MQTVPPKLPPALSSPLVTKHAACLIKRHLWNKAAKSALIVIDFMNYTGDSRGNRTRLVLAPTYYQTFYMKQEICWNFFKILFSFHLFFEEMLQSLYVQKSRNVNILANWHIWVLSNIKLVSRYLDWQRPACQLFTNFASLHIGIFDRGVTAMIFFNSRWTHNQKNVVVVNERKGKGKG